MIDIKAFRKENKIKQSEICELLKVKQPYLSAIESGKRPLSEDKYDILYMQYGDILLKYKIATSYESKFIKSKGGIGGAMDAFSKNIEVFEQWVAEKDKLLTEKDRLIAEKERYIAMLERRVTELEKRNLK